MRTGSVAAPDGVRIVYDVRGSGPTTLLFVHCWSCDRSFWQNQVDVFAGLAEVASRSRYTRPAFAGSMVIRSAAFSMTTRRCPSAFCESTAVAAAAERASEIPTRSRIDLCMDKIVGQLRRHKDKVRDRQGPSHGEKAVSAE